MGAGDWKGVQNSSKPPAGFRDGSDGEQSACDVGDSGLIPGWGRCPGEGNSYPLQYSCLENSMDRGAWRAIVHEVAKSQMWLSEYATIQRETLPLSFSNLLSHSCPFRHWMTFWWLLHIYWWLGLMCYNLPLSTSPTVLLENLGTVKDRVVPKLCSSQLCQHQQPYCSPYPSISITQALNLGHHPHHIFKLPIRANGESWRQFSEL